MEKCLIPLIRGVHLLILLFVCLGWAFSSYTLLYGHIIFIPLMVLHWKTNHGTCFLTDIENSIKGTPSQGERAQFVRSVISELFRISPNPKLVELGVYLITWTAWLVSVIRVI